MGLLIEDGGGSGRHAHVNLQHQLGVDGVVRDANKAAALLGDAYNFNTTAAVIYTTANESGIAWIANGGTREIVIATVAYSTAGSTGGGTAPGVLRFYRNSTGGTLLSTGVSVPPVNRDHGSAKTLTGTFLRGTGAALTQTGGTQFLSTHVPQNSRFDLDIGYFVLRPGNTFIATYQPPAGNTSQSVMFAAQIYEVV